MTWVLILALIAVWLAFWPARERLPAPERTELPPARYQPPERLWSQA